MTPTRTRTRTSRHGRIAARTWLSLVLLAGIAPALAADLSLQGQLAGGNVVSSTESPATGEVRAMLDDDGTLTLQMGYAGLGEDATGAALHVGTISENGRKVADLPLPATGAGGRIDTTLDLSDDDAGHAATHGLRNAGGKRASTSAHPARRSRVCAHHGRVSSWSANSTTAMNVSSTHGSWRRPVSRHSCR